MLSTIPAIHAAPLAPIPLWTAGAPGALGAKDDDIPTLTAYLPAPEKASGAAMVVLPGGGYGLLAGHEGAGYAEWLARNGIAAIVLKYRLGIHGYQHPAPLQDATRAMRLTRAKAAEWKIDPKRIGIMGSSAGAHLATTVLTHSDAGKAADQDPVEHLGSRPDLAVLCYPVITMGPNGHDWTRENLLGKDPSPALIDELSSEKHVTKEMPPCFIWHTWEDDKVKVENALDFAAALRKAGVPFDLHIYQHGIHGIGLYGAADAPPGTPPLPWAADCLYWLKQQGFLK